MCWRPRVRVFGLCRRSLGVNQVGMRNPKILVLQTASSPVSKFTKKARPSSSCIVRVASAIIIHKHGVRSATGRDAPAAQG